MGERKRYIESIRAEVERTRSEPGRVSKLRDLIQEDLIEVADNLAEFSVDDRVAIFESLDPADRALMLEEVDEADQELLIERLADAELPKVLEEMDPDDVADIVDERSEIDRERLLTGLDSELAEQIRELASYPPDTAGGLMTPEFLAVDESATVQDVKDLIRSRDDFESIGNIFVTTDRRLLGVFSVRELILASNDTIVATFLTRDVIHVDVHDDREEVYRVMETYHLFSLPVVDDNHDLVGIVTVDDVLTVAEEEASEDVFRMAGSGDLHPTRDTIFGRVTKRLPYLTLSVFGGFGSAFILKVMGKSDVIDDVTYFLPMIPMIGGNVAMQSSAVMVRGFATGEVELARTPRVIRDEVTVGLIVGFACAIVGAFIALVLTDNDPQSMAVTVLCAIVSLSLVSATLGTGIPAVFHRLGVDPAIAAGPFVTGLIDMVGCALYIAFIAAFRP